MKYILAALLFATLLCHARANTWDFAYSGTGVNASGVITTGAAITTFEGSAGFVITDITGLRNGIAITGLQEQATVNPSVGYTISQDGRWAFNNVLLASGGFDLWGVLFHTADNKEYNLYNQGGQYIDGNFNNCRFDLKPVTFKASSVPDGGSTLGFMGLGLVGMGLVLRKRK